MITQNLVNYGDYLQFQPLVPPCLPGFQLYKHHKANKEKQNMLWNELNIQEFTKCTERPINIEVSKDSACVEGGQRVII